MYGQEEQEGTLKHMTAVNGFVQLRVWSEDGTSRMPTSQDVLYPSNEGIRNGDEGIRNRDEGIRKVNEVFESDEDEAPARRKKPKKKGGFTNLFASVTGDKPAAFPKPKLK